MGKDRDYGLNVRQKRFVMELAKGKSQTQAYIDAGFDMKNRDAAATGGWRMLRNVEVLNYLNDLISKQEFKTRMVEATASYEAVKSLKQLLANVHNLLFKVLSKDSLTAEDRKNISTLLSIIRTIRDSDKTEINIDLQNMMKQAQKMESDEDGYKAQAKEILKIIEEIEDES